MFPTLLMQHVEQAHQCCIYMNVSQCPNLVSALSCFVSQAILPVLQCHEQGTDLFQAAEQSDLTAIPRLYAAAQMDMPEFLLVVDQVQTFPVSVLNDALQSILLWASADNNGIEKKLHILLTFTAPIPVLPREQMPSTLYETKSWLPSIIMSRVLMRMDVYTIAWPDKSEFWERAICPFFLCPTTSMWLGRSVFEMVRRRYWHTSPSWDAVAQCIRLCYLEHFRTQAITAFFDEVPDPALLSQHWTEEMKAYLLVTLTSPYPKGSDLPHDIRMLVSDEKRLLRSLPMFQHELRSYMTRCLLHFTGIEILLHVTRMNGVYGTKLGITGAIAAVLEWAPPFTDWDYTQTAAYALTATTPLLAQFDTLLNNVYATLTNTLARELLDALLRRLEEFEAIPDEIDLDIVQVAKKQLASAPTPSSDAQEEAPLASFVQQYFTRWPAATNTLEASHIPGLAAAIWTYDFADPVSTVLEGASRANVLLALDAPTETLASMWATSRMASGQLQRDMAEWPEYEAHISEVDRLRTVQKDLELASVPDVCRLYALYKDTGKFINLADWYEAFVQSLEGDQKRMERAGIAIQGQNTASAQVRFSLAVNELAHMGLVGPTSRKVEHVGRTVWDLTSYAMEDDA